MPNRKVCFICYKESLKDSIENLLNNDNVKDYAYILHNKDTTETGEIKKEHYHVFIKYNKPTNKDNISSKFSIDKSLINYCKDEKAYIIYMSHINENNKYKYPITEIKSNLNIPLIYENWFNGVITEEDSIKLILEKLKENISLIELVQWCMSKGIYKIFKSNYWIIRDIRKEK